MPPKAAVKAVSVTTSTSTTTDTVPSTLTSLEAYALLALSGICLAILASTLNGPGAPLATSIAFSGLAFAITFALIRWLGPSFMRVGLKGKDMSKVRKIEIPETMGAVCAVVYLLAIIVFIPFPFYKDIVAATSGGGSKDVLQEDIDVNIGRHLHRFPHSKLASYLSAILSLQSVVILGLGDDLFDIRWRHKVLIPAFASIPMLIVYFVDFGVTSVVVPTALRPYLGEIMDLGWLYFAYMSSISIFAPNSINILAGINGLEVGQSIVIALLILLNDLLYLPLPLLLSLLAPTTNPTSTRLTLTPAQSAHLSSIYLLLPFLGVSLALFKHNFYPARVFVGDTYCYFAGMVFAVVSIQAHFSKTLLLLMVPQIANFVYSTPQLFHVVPIPRHRLPHFVAERGWLEASWVDFGTGVGQGNGAGAGSVGGATVGLPKYRTLAKPRRPNRLVQMGMKLLWRLKLLDIQVDETSGEVTRCTNMTLINLWLVWFGPKREDRLCLELMAFQTVLGLVGLWVRHRLALLVFSSDNL